MNRPTVSNFDFNTQETIVREMNDEEYSDYLARVAMFEEEEQAHQEKIEEEAAAKAAVEQKLSALGLDLETVRLLAKL